MYISVCCYKHVLCRILSVELLGRRLCNECNSLLVLALQLCGQGKSRMCFMECVLSTTPQAQ